jgi:hypothetical protein
VTLSSATRDVRSRRCAVSLLIVLLSSALPLAAKDSKQPFTVRDSIEWTYVLPVSTDAGSSSRDVALFSPQRSYLVLQTRRGDLDRNVNVESLLLYVTRELEAFSAGRISVPPHAAPVVTVNAARDEDSLAAVQWLGDARLGWIAKGSNDRKQAFAVGVPGEAPTQLTASETDVVGFAEAEGIVAYYACVPHVKQRPLVVRVESFAEALPPMDNNEEGCYQTTPIELFVRQKDQRSSRVALPPMRLFPHLKRIWMAPNGKSAVILAPAVNAPASWAEYITPDPEQLGYTAQWVRSDATSMDLINRTRYLLADLTDGTVRPLLDAPSGQVSQNFTPPEVFWRKDGRSVVVSNTYLPLDGSTGDARIERASRPAIAEVDIASGASRVIEWEPVASDLQTPVSSPIVAFDWDGAADRLAVIHETRVDGAVERRSYTREAARWRRDSWERKTRGRLVVEQTQGLNERPKIRVAMGPAAKRRLLFDPNPRAERLTFGATRVFRWKDANGISWTGGLMFPPGYESSRRYPLIVQTHGFTPAKFLLDGPMYDGQGGTAFAAQAFASAGFVVLQIEDNPATITQDECEGPAVAEGFNSGIEQLVREGLADPTRVGLIAFSRTGYHALHLVARHPTLLRALSLSDTLHAGYSVFLFNVNTSASADLARLTLGNPTVPNVGDWFARNPLYSLAQSTAAVRLENMGIGLGLWEPYAILKQAGRPVEFVVYPDGSHVLQKPQERLESQGGTVDWFRFWLQGYEDDDSSKVEQYRRWRGLRDAANR